MLFDSEPIEVPVVPETVQEAVTYLTEMTRSMVPLDKRQDFDHALQQGDRGMMADLTPGYSFKEFNSFISQYGSGHYDGHRFMHGVMVIWELREPALVAIGAVLRSHGDFLREEVGRLLIASSMIRENGQLDVAEDFERKAKAVHGLILDLERKQLRS
jgi:hypothetical protein